MVVTLQKARPLVLPFRRHLFADRTEPVMLPEVQDVHGIGLRPGLVPADDQQGFVVLVGRLVPEVVAPRDHEAAVGERVDDDHLVVDDRVAGLQ